MRGTISPFLLVKGSDWCCGVCVAVYCSEKVVEEAADVVKDTVAAVKVRLSRGPTDRTRTTCRTDTIYMYYSRSRNSRGPSAG